MYIGDAGRVIGMRGETRMRIIVVNGRVVNVLRQNVGWSLADGERSLL